MFKKFCLLLVFTLAILPQLYAQIKTTPINKVSINQTTRPALDDKKVQLFIKKMVKKHQFNTQDLQQLFSNISFKVWDKQNIAPKTRRVRKPITWDYYQTLFLTNNRIVSGLKFWHKYQKTLKRASEKFGIPEQIIVAILGIETNYGLNKGKHPVLETLTKKAFNGYRRSKFYKSELEQFLLLTRSNHIAPLSITGSHAGAMGYAQFIASSYRYYAIDFDDDNKVDLLHNPDDAIGSIANYFSAHHWQADQPIASKLTNLKPALSQLSHQKPTRPKTTLKKWYEKKLTIPKLDLSKKAEIIRLNTKTEPEYWLVFYNFYALTRYNHSNLYAMAVYQLSEILLSRYHYNL